MNTNVLLVGRNPVVLSKLAVALTNEGMLVVTTSLVEQASEDFNAADFTLIAFGRGVNDPLNAQLKAAFKKQNPSILFVDGLAPVIPLLVNQIKYALLADATDEKVLTQFRYQSDSVQVVVRENCHLQLALYELDAVHNTTQHTLFSEFVKAGNHTFAVPVPLDSTGSIRFLVAEVNNRELAVVPLR